MNRVPQNPVFYPHLLCELVANICIYIYHGISWLDKPNYHIVDDLSHCMTHVTQTSQNIPWSKLGTPTIGSNLWSPKS